jgi:hypothetical protein
MNCNKIENWYPRKLLGHSQEPACSWIYLGAKLFTEPFFDDTIAACAGLDENYKSFLPVSNLPIMTERSEQVDAVDPTAIIFHVSRCGSTLLSQLIALDPENIVLSEVPFFDDLLRLPFKNATVGKALSANYLKAAIQLYGRIRTGNEKNLFIKTDSWHIHFYSIFRSLFPSIPFIFLYRDPWEVMQSQQRQRGMHAVPGIIEPALFGFSNEQTNQYNLDQFMYQVMETYFKKMVAISMSDPLAIPVNYNEGITTIFEKLYRICGLNKNANTDHLIAERERFHAKHPHQLFKEDNTGLEIPNYVLPLMEMYRQLDELRMARI